MSYKQIPLHPRAVFCAVCKETVDAVRSWKDPATQEWNFDVYCHDEIESFSLSEADLVAASEINFVEAFRPKQKELGNE